MRDVLLVLIQEWKSEVLFDLWDNLCMQQGIVFCNTQQNVDALAEVIRARGITVMTMVGLHRKSRRNCIVLNYPLGCSDGSYRSRS